MKKRPDKFFKDWLAEEVENAFGITRLRSLPLLEDITKNKLSHDHPIRPILEQYRLELFDNIDSWNEDEYKFIFIGPYLKLVNFNTPYFKVFTQRPMSVTYDNGSKFTSGNVEFMLARGRQIPNTPHFFLHEYKPEKNRDNDPLGQLLIAMVAAQRLNQDNKTVYGIYVNGRNWFIVVLDGEGYAVSNPFVATSEDIFDLYSVLFSLKERMEEMYHAVP